MPPKQPANSSLSQKQFGSAHRKTSSFWRWLNLTRIGYLLIALWSISGALATGVNGRFTEKVESLARVVFFRARNNVAPPENIVILEIDQFSITQGEFFDLEPVRAWPWQRSAYATVIERLMEAGARSVSVDIIFDLPSSYGEEDDQKLQAALERYPQQVVLASQFEASEREGIAAANLIKPQKDFRTQNSNPALINYPIGADGRIHRLADDYAEQISNFLGTQDNLLTFAQATLQAAQIEYGSPNGEYIHFYGPAGVFKRVPFWDVIYDQNWEVHQSKETFKDKIVLIGATAASLQDFARTPTAEMMPGVELHANAIATLIEERAITQALPNPWLRGGLVLVLVAGTGVFLVKLIQKPLETLIATFALALAWGGISYLAFTQGSLILPTAVPTIAITLVGISSLATEALQAQWERFRIYQTLGRYVAGPIVNEILNQHSDDFQRLLKGRRTEAAILFADIRGFTTLSLKLQPEELVEQLNTYLNAMVEEILDEGGTLDKFIGDAIMAEFGSPISRGAKKDAMNAVSAAINMRRALVKLHQHWEKEGKEFFFNGIGISYGEVIAGDIGSSRRREFAVIGDAVNVASRVEGLTGKLWADILITDSLYELVKEEIQVVAMGEYELKGRGKNKVKLYSVIGTDEEDMKLYLYIRDELRRRFGYKNRANSNFG